MVLRSLMFVPGHNRKLLESAGKSAADALILDLEDSVPETQKAEARHTVKEFIGARSTTKPLYVRINAYDTRHFNHDLNTLIGEDFQGWVYPKACRPQDIRLFSRFFRGYDIIPLIESAGAVLNAFSIAKAAKAVTALAFGCEDYTADIEGIHSDEALLTPRAMIAMAARAARVVPIDTVHIDVHNLESLRKQAMTGRSLGFEGMLVLHPKELPVVHEVFTPTDQEAAEAEEMLRLSKEAAASGKGVALMNNRFIGPPLVRQAEALLRRYKSCNQS